MTGLCRNNVEILLILVKIQNAINLPLIRQYKPIPDQFILKPLYRLMIGNSNFATVKDGTILLEIKETLDSMKQSSMKQSQQKKKKFWRLR